MDGEAEAYDDDGDCNGCLDGGGERRLRGLGEGVAGLVGLRPRAEAWGSAVEPGRGGSALEPAEGGALEPEAWPSCALERVACGGVSGSLSDENDSSSDIFWQTKESWNAGKLSLDRGRQAASIYIRIVLVRMVS